MTDYLFRFVIPAAFSVLPKPMDSQAATAMLLAIALQESLCAHRRQVRGPARGFWQFEQGGGVAGVIKHKATARPLEVAQAALCYNGKLRSSEAMVAIEHNDVLACVYARLLLFTLPTPLPEALDVDDAWRQYLAAWRPGAEKRADAAGKARLEHTWHGNYARAWALARGDA